MEGWDPSSAMNKVEKAVSMAGASSMVSHNSLQTNKELIMDDGSRATITKQSHDRILLPR